MTTTNTITLINALNEVSYAHQDLMEVAIDFYEDYSQANAFQSNMLNKLWSKPEFLNQAVLAVRESIILSTAAITLEETVPFEEIINGCINLDTQQFHIENMKLNPIETSLSINFFSSLRKSVFKQLYTDAANLQQASELSNEILEHRFSLFNRKFA